MIAGRPINLWLGLTTSVGGAVTVIAIVLGADPTVVATIVGALGGVVGAAIALVAGQPPTLEVGDTFHIATPAGQPNFETTVAQPPAASKPVPDPQP